MTVFVFLKIKELLDKNKIEYSHITHEHVHRSEDAAKIRGTSLDSAAKAIIVKAEKKAANGEKIFEFFQCVIGGDKRIDLKRFKVLLDSRNVSLASPDEVLERTGCTIGSVPPFGNFFNMKVYMEKSLLDKDQIVFSAGTHNDSILLKPQDYLKVVEPVVELFAKE